MCYPAGNFSNLVATLERPDISVPPKRNLFFLISTALITLIASLGLWWKASTGFPGLIDYPLPIAWFMFASAAALAFVGACALSYNLRIRDRTSFSLAIVIGAIGQIVAIMLLFGAAIHNLNPIVLLLAHLTLTSFLLHIAAWIPIHSQPSPAKQFRTFLRSLWEEIRPNYWLLAMLIISGGTFLWNLFIILILPPSDYDSLSYHLVASASWVQAGQIAITHYHIYANADPAASETLYAWLMVWFQGLQVVRAGQLICSVGGLFAIIGIARFFGLSRPIALQSGLLFFLTPIVFLQMTSNYVDLAFASFFLSTIYFIYHYTRTWARADLFLSGISGGLLLGTKSTGIAYLIIAAITLLALLIWQKQFWQRLWGFCIIFTLPAFLLGSFWYIRTWMTYGSPFYPVQVIILGHSVFSGLLSVQQVIYASIPTDFARLPDWMQVIISWLSEPSLHFSFKGGLGLQWTYLEMPALLALTLKALHKRNISHLFLILPFFLAFLVQPGNFLSRFSIVLIAPGAIALMIVIERSPYILANIVRSILLLFVAFGCLLVVGRSVGGVHGSLTALYALKHPDQRTIGSLYLPEYHWADSIPAGSHIATLNYTIQHPTILPFFGQRLQNSVFPLDQVQTLADFQQFIKNHHINYLFTTSGDLFDTWAKQDPAHFHLIDTTDNINRVYQIDGFT